jgi:hypothetical protein
MVRLAVAVSLLLSAVCAVAATASTSDAFAVTLAQQSIAALTSGTPVYDVTLNANVISILGSDGETGTGTFLAKGTTESSVNLNLSGGTRSDIRSVSNGVPAGEWSKNGATTPTHYALHNSLTDAAWFLPALSSLTQTANANFVFKYVGQEQYNGANVQHIRVFQIYTSDTSNMLQASRTSAMDFYLDAVSFLPVAVAFKAHPDADMNTDIPVAIQFGNYQVVSGIQIPFHTQRLLNGTVVLDITVTSAVVNSGLSDSQFNLQ